MKLIEKINEKSVEFVVRAGMFVPLVNMAHAQAALGKKDPLFDNIGQVAAKLCTVFNWIFTFALILSFIYIVLAAIKYITGSGSPEKVAEANKSLMWGVIGIAVALVARGVPVLVGAFLGGSVGQAC